MATGKQLEVEGLSSGLEDRNEPAEETGVNLQSPFQEKKLPAIVEDGMQLKDKEVNENVTILQPPSRHDIGELGALDNNVNEQDQMVAVNSDKSTIEINSTTNPKRIQCPFCDYKPANTGNVKHHVENVHQGLKYNCTNCDYKDGDKSNLKKHMERVHFGVTYKCELCRQVFSSKSSLKHHADIKHTELFFNCENCEFKAPRRCILDKHILVQHEGITFDCQICQLKYNWKESLNHHNKKNHEGLNVMSVTMCFQQ